jgi:hypothetical protein
MQHQIHYYFPCCLKASIVKTFPRATVQVKKETLGGALAFQMLLQGKRQHPIIAFDLKLSYML